jgi:hypothetical protein
MPLGSRLAMYSLRLSQLCFQKRAILRPSCRTTCKRNYWMISMLICARPVTVRTSRFPCRECSWTCRLQQHRFLSPKRSRGQEKSERVSKGSISGWRCATGSVGAKAQRRVRPSATSRIHHRTWALCSDRWPRARENDAWAVCMSAIPCGYPIRLGAGV